MTTEARNRAIDLLAAGLNVGKTAQALGADARDIADVKEEWAGLILEKRRGLSGRRFDGTPIPNVPTGGGRTGTASQDRHGNAADRPGTDRSVGGIHP